MKRIDETETQVNIKTPAGLGKEGIGAEGDVLLTVPQAAAFLGWAIGTVYHKLHELPGVVHLSSRCVRIWKSALISYARERTRL